HKEWRKIAKRERRRRIRTQLAKDRDDIHYNEEYLKEQQILHTIELEMIERINAEENEKWLCAERRAMEQWQEWEMEQKKKKAEEERMKAIEEENRLKQETFMKNLEEFISGDSTDPPRELLISRETRPHAAICPFFSKTGCCRFGDQCSRNHQHPGISKILLATNFFVHFGMDNATPSEYDTDIMLEYEEIETYKQFKEFFFDVLEEFKKFGKVVIFKVSFILRPLDLVHRSQGSSWQRHTCVTVCNNMEKHLRGNVYVEYAELRCAVAAYRSLHARWYGGRQLSLQFTLVTSWKNAICG
ncbi:U2 small nuclear ribonucleoprotein auxiliary factor 35 kDa subunit-related protein 1, partial [Operophtera brumata]